MKKETLHLTKAEEQVMHILWKIRKGFVKDVVEQFGNPKPAYNTVSTIIRILEKKGFVAYKSFGNTYEYFPTVSKDEYTSNFLGSFVKNYFGNSYNRMVSFFANEKDISIRDLEEMKKIVEEEIKRKKKNG
jgi:BlaI family transcriptional regulator, penicillinase repressor